MQKSSVFNALMRVENLYSTKPDLSLSHKSPHVYLKMKSLNNTVYVTMKKAFTHNTTLYRYKPTIIYPPSGSA